MPPLPNFLGCVTQVLINEAGGIPPLVDLLRSGPLSGRECAAGALWNLAMYEDNRVEIADVRA